MRPLRTFFVRGLTAACAFTALSSWLLAQPQDPLFEPTTYPVPVIADLMDVDVADVNGDGYLDIGVLGGARYHVFFGVGDGSFLPPEDSFGSGYSATLADVTGDGLADRLLVDGVSIIKVQVSQGDGQFSQVNSLAAGCYPFEASVADLNGDALADLAVARGDGISCANGFTSFLGDGSGGFGSADVETHSLSLAEVLGLALADLDGDGLLDVALTTAGGSLARWLGAGDGSFGRLDPYPTKGWTVDAADVDADGWQDMVSALPAGLQVYLGTGQDDFSPAIVSSGGLTSFNQYDPHIALGDFNADGRVDAAGSLNGQLMIALGLGSGAFEAPAAHFRELSVDWLRAADVDGDGSDDLVMTGGADHDQLYVLLNSRTAWAWDTVAPGLLAAGLDAPQLSPAGTLEDGEPVSLALDGGASGAPAMLIVGAASINAPFKGGVLVPLPALLLPLSLDLAGGFDLSAPLPTALPSGAKLYLQTWIVDAAGPVGFTSSNAVVGTAP